MIFLGETWVSRFEEAPLNQLDLNFAEPDISARALLMKCTEVHDLPADHMDTVEQMINSKSIMASRLEELICRYILRGH